MRVRRRDGFTLIEVVVVLTIISILASIAMVNYREVQNKAEAARIATQLHYIEDAIIEAIIEGAQADDFANVDGSNVESSVLGDYLTRANFEDLPEGISLRMNAVNSTPFGVMLMLRSDAAHRIILEELQAMYPHTVGGNPRAVEIIKIDSGTLSVTQRTLPPTP